MVIHDAQIPRQKDSLQNTLGGHNLKGKDEVNEKKKKGQIEEEKKLKKERRLRLI